MPILEHVELAHELDVLQHYTKVDAVSKARAELTLNAWRRMGIPGARTL